MKKLFLGLLACLLLGVSAAQGAPRVVKSAWLDEYEAFPAWYAHMRHWDTDAGIDLEMKTYPSGKYLMDNVGGINWDIAGMGGAPAAPGILRGETCVVGIGSDEAAANAIYVRPDSPLLQAVGQTLSPRDHARLVTGKIVLCPRGTSAHQLLLLWLERMGLNEDSIALLDTAPDEAASGLANGVGDMAVLWSPWLYAAEQSGLKPLLTGKSLGLVQPTLLMARKEYADANAPQVRAFLTCYLRAVEALAALPTDEVASLYQRFRREVCGEEISRQQAVREVETHTLYPLARQRELLGSSGEFQKWLGDVIAFHEQTGELSRGQTRALRETPLARPDLLPAAVPAGNAAGKQARP